jgi:organic hydroperoxide reductase OsmC/OhrA
LGKTFSLSQPIQVVVELMGDPDKEHAVTLRHPQTKEDRLAAPSQKSAGLVMSDKLPPAAV